MRRTLGGWFAALLVGLSAWAIDGTRGEAADLFARSGKTSEVYALPSPEHLEVFSLGYRAALSDLLFGRTLVAAGTHFSERRVFEQLDSYLEAVVHLEPYYRDVYYYADALLNLSTVEMPKRNYRIARDLQARGLRLFPDDAALWLTAGQFVAYLAPQHLPPEEDKKEWRLAGARILEHACSIWPDPQHLPPTCWSASHIFSRAGEIDANVETLQRLVAITEDPTVRAQAETRLRELRSVQQNAEFQDRLKELSELHAKDLPLVGRTTYQIVGPPWDGGACAGRRSMVPQRACATSFAERDEALP